MAAAYVRLTTFAFEDLKHLLAVDPQIVRKALTKMILLERDPTAGEPLLGNLVGWRKLTVGNRDWRVVWRISTDASGATVIDIAEVWAVGARSDSHIYEEMKARLADAGSTMTTMALADAVELLGRSAKNVAVTPEPDASPMPEWLTARLKHQAGMSDEQLRALTPEAAMEAWEAFITRKR